MLHKAVYWQLLYSNPCERVQPPKTRKPKRRYYDDEQCKTLISGLNELSADEIKYKVAIILTIFTGVRLGELLGLEWSDIDFNNGIISINKSSQYLADKGIFTKEPKTESSIRDVAIPDFVVSLLDEYKAVYGELWTNSNRLFVQSGGKPMHLSTISKWFVKYVGQIGLPVINFHGLRHTNATLLISQNIDIAVVASRLGHAHISTTFNFYVHPIISHNKNAGNVLETLLIPNKT
ncbi:MAG: site-specific integrase [Clostridia bacterium]|nr:site-specific integrase [Clostridia bacterium]